LTRPWRADLYQEAFGVHREATLWRAWPAEHGTVRQLDLDFTGWFSA
jgi:hypothetical protein